MNNLEHLLVESRSNIRGDEALLKRILSHIPEKKQTRRFISPYVAYALTSFVSVYMLILVALPIYREYQAYRIENDVDLMSIDEEGAAVDSGINDMEDADMSMLE